ncbi:hypothetical protein E4K68_07610 [Desulfosporosinus sp. Sb-LF]|nr:hypothetical protein E4K68_07610 [Desulfosporosinus sp. Sb-LF]
MGCQLITKAGVWPVSIADTQNVCEKLDQLISVMTRIEKKMSGNCLQATPLDEKINTSSIPQKVTLVEIRAVLNVKREKAKDLLKKYGVRKLSDLSPSDYPEFLREAEVM